MPLLELSKLTGSPVFVGETEFLDEEENEHVKLYIYMAKAEFNDEALQAEYGAISPSFVDVLKSYVNSMNVADLKKTVNENDGKISVKLDGTDVTLVRGTHFFFNNKDKNSYSA